MTLCAQLTQPGFELREAESGEQALKMIREWPPDVILLDVMMPGMDGFEVCRLIKGDPRWETIPVIICTALGTREHLLKGLLAGADEFLIKPIHGAELRLRVRNLLKVKAYDLLKCAPPRWLDSGASPVPWRRQSPAHRALCGSGRFVTFSKDRQAELSFRSSMTYSQPLTRCCCWGLRRSNHGGRHMLAGGLEEVSSRERSAEGGRVALSMQEASPNLPSAASSFSSAPASTRDR